MELLKKENIKGFLITCLIIIFIIIVLTNISLVMQSIELKKETNKIICAIIGNVINKYPEAEKDVIKELSTITEQSVENGKNILEKYGIDTEKIISAVNIQENLQKNIFNTTMWVFILGISLIIAFLLYIKKSNKKIKEITNYLKQIQNRNYCLKIEENEEGELSNLKNEIYKITVMLKEQAEQLEKNKIYLSDSISDISHQIRTPITSISVMLDILKENTQLPQEKKEEFLYEVSRQIEWINWLVISLLKLSKLDSGTVELKKEKVLVKNLMLETIHDLTIPLEIKNQKININGKEEVSFKGDFKWSKEAIINIIKNCMEHTEEGKTIEINFLENVLFTQINIIDSGEGIDKEDLPNIFKRFYKGKNANKNSFGIGLALAKSIIKNQGGDLSVKSKKGEGSNFCIKFYKGIY